MTNESSGAERIQLESEDIRVLDHQLSDPSEKPLIKRFRDLKH